MPSGMSWTPGCEEQAKANFDKCQAQRVFQRPTLLEEDGGVTYIPITSGIPQRLHVPDSSLNQSRRPDVFPVEEGSVY